MRLFRCIRRHAVHESLLFLLWQFDKLNAMSYAVNMSPVFYF